MFRVRNLRFRVKNLGFRVKNLGLIKGLGFRVHSRIL